MHWCGAYSAHMDPEGRGEANRSERDTRLALMARNLESSLAAFEAKNLAELPHHGDLQEVFAPFFEIGKLPGAKQLARVAEAGKKIAEAKKIYNLSQTERHLLLWLNNLLIEIEAQANDREVASWNSGVVKATLERLEKIAFLGKWSPYAS